MIVAMKKKQIIIFFMIRSPQKDAKAVAKIDLFQNFILSEQIKSQMRKRIRL
jgi:hypothetical protein